MAKAVVEIQLTADVKDLAHVRQLGRVIQPGAAVQERNAAHPIRMLVEHEQVTWLHEPAHECQRDVMEVAGAKESAESVCRKATTCLGPHGLLKAPKSPEATAEPEPWSPAFGAPHLWLKSLQNRGLRGDATVEIDKPGLHGGVS